VLKKDAAGGRSTSYSVVAEPKKKAAKPLEEAARRQSLAVATSQHAKSDQDLLRGQATLGMSEQ
jgi:hypothetical protein